MRPDYPDAISRPAAEENFGPRPSDVEIDCVVLHATAGSLSATLGWFANPATGIAYNPLAAFPPYAREHDLGTPQTEEFDFSYEGVDYRGQGSSRAIVYATVGDWGNLKELSW